MAYDYDKLYRDTQHALGAPKQAFVDFFESCEKANLRVLDIGCGQGRDALFIARLGHRVVGVDLSAAGIDDLNADAKKEALSITGIVADITSYVPDGQFDVVLIDRTLHMLDHLPRLAVLARLATHVAPGGYLLIADERANMQGFKDVMTDDAFTWDILLDTKGMLFFQCAA